LRHRSTGNGPRSRQLPRAERLARKGRAFRSLNTLIVKQGGEHVLYGSVLTLAAATHAWAGQTGTTVHELAPTIIR
jgi:hypothetical protein